MPNRVLTYQKQAILTTLMVLGLFAMLLHPVTHVFAEHTAEHSHAQNEAPAPIDHSNDCIECVLTAATALENPPSVFTDKLSASTHIQYSDSSPEANRLIIGFSLRGPPFGLYMS